MNRRALLSGAAATLAFSALPLQLPSADARKSPNRELAWRRYRKLRRLLHKNPPLAQQIKTLFAPSTKPGGYLRLDVVHRPKRSSWISSAHAQDFVLEPIQVIAPLSFAEYSNDSFNFSSQNAYSSLLAYNSYINYYLPMIAAQNAAAQAAADQAALVNVMVVPPPDPEPTIIPPVVEPEPEPAPEPSLSDPLFNNPYSQYVASALGDAGLTVTEAMAVAFFIEGAATVLEFALPPVVATASQLIAEGLAAGTIAAQVELFAAGLTVSLTGIGLAAATVAVVIITLRYVVPEIERLRRANVSDFTGDVYVEATPLVVAPDPGPVTVDDSTPEYPWYWDYEQQTWIYTGKDQ